MFSLLKYTNLSKICLYYGGLKRLELLCYRGLTTRNHVCLPLKQSLKLKDFALPCTSAQGLKSSASDDEIDLDKPVKFSTSKAASWSSRNLYYAPESAYDTPWFQPYVVIASVASILIYFTLLREENDIDQELSKSFSDRFEGYEELQLEIRIKEYQQLGKDTAALEKRLSEINALKQK